MTFEFVQYKPYNISQNCPITQQVPTRHSASIKLYLGTCVTSTLPTEPVTSTTGRAGASAWKWILGQSRPLNKKVISCTTAYFTLTYPHPCGSWLYCNKLTLSYYLTQCELLPTGLFSHSHKCLNSYLSKCSQKLI